MTENATTVNDEEDINPEIFNRYCGVIGCVRRPQNATGAGHSDNEIDSNTDEEDIQASDSESPIMLPEQPEDNVSSQQQDSWSESITIFI
jgi:hypothetical protein